MEVVEICINFWKAVFEGNIPALQTIIEGGHVNIDALFGEGVNLWLLEREGGDALKGHVKLSALMVASKVGNCDLARFLLEKGAQIDLRGINGRSALMVASRYGCTEVVELLLEKPLDNQPVSSVRFSRNSKYVLSSGWDGKAMLWELSTCGCG